MKSLLFFFFKMRARAPACVLCVSDINVKRDVSSLFFWTFFGLLENLSHLPLTAFRPEEGALLESLSLKAPFEPRMRVPPLFEEIGARVIGE